MIGRILAAGALLALAACASSSNDLPPAAAAPPPPELVAPSAPGVVAPGVVAPGVAAPPAPRPPAPAGDVVVPGQVERVIPPTGDPRTTSERMADIRAWDQCVMRAQGVDESNPTSPALDTPEDLCREQLGMANRGAVPDSRRPDR